MSIIFDYSIDIIVTIIKILEVDATYYSIVVKFSIARIRYIIKRLAIRLIIDDQNY